MGKRKISEKDLPQTIDMQHVEGASTSGRPGPLAVYFPSGFQPGRDGSCSWEVHSNTARHNDHIVIARAVCKLTHPVMTMLIVKLCCRSSARAHARSAAG